MGAYSILWYTRESVFKFVQVTRVLAPKYLTGLMLWNIWQGGNSAPEDELHLCGAARRSSAPGAVHLEQNLGAKLLE